MPCATAASSIDLSQMRAVQVDPKARRVRAQGGTTWGDYNRETQLYGLATTGGVVSTTGIAGLTLGGGLGWLMGKHGLAVDNLRSATLVTAAGEVVRASDDEQPRPVLGHPRRRRQLRRGDVARIRRAPGWPDRDRRPGRPSVQRRA